MKTKTILSSFVSSLSSLISPVAMLALTAMAISYAAHADPVPSAHWGVGSASEAAAGAPNLDWAKGWKSAAQGAEKKILTLPCQDGTGAFGELKAELSSQEEAAAQQGATKKTWERLAGNRELLAKKMQACGIHGVETGNGIER